MLLSDEEELDLLILSSYFGGLTDGIENCGIFVLIISSSDELELYLFALLFLLSKVEAPTDGSLIAGLVKPIFLVELRLSEDDELVVLTFLLISSNEGFST